MPSLKLSGAGSAGPSLAQASPSLSSFLTLAVFQRGGASQRPTVAPAGYAKARFGVAQNAQDSNRGVDTAGNLVNVG
jgi:hypothetical protein